MQITVEQFDRNAFGLANTWYPAEFDYNPQVMAVNITFDGDDASTPVGQDTN